MYYRLKEPWAFRGWRLAPYALRAEAGEFALDRPHFLGKEAFLALLLCDGQERVELADLSDEGAKAIAELVAEGTVEESPEPLPPLQDWQRYHVFPSRYLDSVHWSITGRCNFRCRHCLMSAPDAHLPQLPFADIEHIAHEIARAGIRQVDITGGEPLVRADFEKIVELISSCGLRIGVVFTNGALLSEGVLDIFERYGQRPQFQLSFDGVGHHDWLRGIPGAEEKADAAFRLLKERGIPVHVAMCIHRGNRGVLRETANYLASLDVKSLKLNAPQEFGTWKQYAEDYALSEDEVWEVYRAYIPQYFEDGMPIGIELDGYFSCRKGRTDYRVNYAHHPGENPDWEKIPYCESVRYGMHIGPDGRAYPCMAFNDSAIKESFPSILEEHLGDITLRGFYRETVETSMADLLARNPECAACEHLSECCGGCMVQDMTEDGDFLVPDSRCCWFHKYVGESGVREVADAALAKIARAYNT